MITTYKAAGEKIIFDFLDRTIKNLPKLEIIDPEWALFNEEKLIDLALDWVGIEDMDWDFKAQIGDDYDCIYPHILAGQYGSKQNWLAAAIEEYLPDESLGYERDWFEWIKENFSN